MSKFVSCDFFLTVLAVQSILSYLGTLRYLHAKWLFGHYKWVHSKTGKRTLVPNISPVVWLYGKKVVFQWTGYSVLTTEQGKNDWVLREVCKALELLVTMRATVFYWASDRGWGTCLSNWMMRFFSMKWNEMPCEIAKFSSISHGKRE